MSKETQTMVPENAEPVYQLWSDEGFGGWTDTDKATYCWWLDSKNPPRMRKLYTAPVATQPGLTQQTLDDVMAGIPARDAEIEALRKEIEALQAQLDTDKVDAERYKAWRDALITGKTAEDDFIRLVADSLPTSVGVSRRPTAAEWDAAIDAARKENSNA